VLAAVPNVSEGRDAAAIEQIGAAFGRAARLLDVHSDPDHNRSVYWLAGGPGELAQALVDGAAAALERIDLAAHEGVHPYAGALDVAPVVHLTDADRGAACAEALLAADRLASELGLPVFLYGLLAGGRTRAELRRGGPAELQRRVDAGELAPDFGPRRLHPRGGAVLVAARAPLVAFNVELAPGATLEDARAAAAAIREGGADGLPHVRAIGLELPRSGRVQVSTNVEDHLAVPLAEVVAAVARHAPVSGAELVGLAPAAALEGFPADVPLRGFDRQRHVLENALA
jgi:glutamate formiminotransferase / 5-formyltetrahydrofolate cyclo-ligase